MSKSVVRVQAALASAGLANTVLELPALIRTAAEAASALGVGLSQIAKSIVMQGKDTGDVYLFIMAGGNRVSMERASDVLGEMVVRFEANKVRQITGFAIGGVDPMGHISRVRTYFDRKLAEAQTIWASGGTPRHMFEISPTDLLAVSQATVVDFSFAPDSQIPNYKIAK